MGRGRSVVEGIREERARMAPIRALADEIVDTSDMTVHELRQFFMPLSRDRVRAPLVVNVLSFGFKHGIPGRRRSDVRRPLPAKSAFHCRHWCHRTGRDRAMEAFMERDQATRQFIEKLEDASASPCRTMSAREELSDGGHRVMGGRHRSVMIAERMGAALKGLPDVKARVKHRDIRRSTK